jgi:hypothetical protein
MNEQGMNGGAVQAGLPHRHSCPYINIYRHYPRR